MQMKKKCEQTRMGIYADTSLVKSKVLWFKTKYQMVKVKIKSLTLNIIHK
jgi:hypothetical protein